MAAKQYFVARGEIHRDGKVIAREGDSYTPKNAAEEKRLLSRGVIMEDVEDDQDSEDDDSGAGGGAKK
ncbi:hypothetical protein SAMN05216571_101408 [Onishia taeanensis]|uniref:Uncharacterized protein n=1 Tax=Onishia taeanensis TaxID=284577 RepID=A0A1G7NFJ5_9GAMM|nr:hypothetical protein [Halomonas taeanensis]SDF72697.1 hypothetical protein SAMN05216571_101408 [Halomonas taeanensis]